MLGGTKYDGGKMRYSLLPKGVVSDIVQVLEYGAGKYGSNNWQGLPDFEDRYYDAMMRHVAAYRAGERCDWESGLPHLAHAMCNLAFLLWKQEQKPQYQPGKPPTPEFT
jgi:hypothetical protein